jgi:HEAT repeats
LCTRKAHPDEALPILVDALKSDDRTDRTDAFDGIRFLGRPLNAAAVPAVAALLETESAERLPPLIAMYQMLEPEPQAAVAALVKLLHRPETMVRHTAGYTLSQRMNDGPNALVREFRSSNDENFRLQVVILLLNGQKAPWVAGIFDEAMQDMSPKIRIAVLNVALQVDHRTGQGWPYVARGLVDPDPEVRLNAAALTRILADERGNLATAFTTMAGQIRGEKGAHIRAELVRNLVHFRGTQYDPTPLLVESLKDEEPNVRLRAIESLRLFRLDDQTATAALVELSRLRDDTVPWVAGPAADLYGQLSRTKR